MALGRPYAALEARILPTAVSQVPTCPGGGNRYYHLDRMIESAARHGADIGCCGTCPDARGLTETALVKGAHCSTLDELTDWTDWAHQVITF